MAKKIILIDDLDGEQEAAETVLFGIDGVDYQIDLTTANADKLRRVLEPFASAARRADQNGNGVTHVKARKAQIAAQSKRDQLDAIRAWAKQQGLEISDRGRIPVVIQDAFDKAHGAS